MESKTIGKINKFVKKSPYPIYEVIRDLMLGKADFCNRKGDMKMKEHYLMMNFVYGDDKHKYMKKIYENINDVELIKKNGAEIYKRGWY